VGSPSDWTQVLQDGLCPCPLVAVQYQAPVTEQAVSSSIVAISVGVAPISIDPELSNRISTFKYGALTGMLAVAIPEIGQVGTPITDPRNVLYVVLQVN
jgi:hypothetical protein